MRKLFTAAAISMLFAYGSTAQANIINVAAPLGSFVSTYTSGPNIAVDDTFNFTLSTYSSFEALVSNNFQSWFGPLQNLTITLTPSSLTAQPATSQASFLTGFLTAGSYALHVTASAATTPISYGLYLSASPAIAPAVPEPETYAMLLAGLGVMGFIARRRNKAAA